MDLREMEKLQDEQALLIRQVRTYLRYMAVALVLITPLMLATTLLAWKMYSENVALALGDMQATTSVRLKFLGQQKSPVILR